MYHVRLCYTNGSKSKNGGNFKVEEENQLCWAFFTQVKIWLLTTNITPTHFGSKWLRTTINWKPNGPIERSTQSLEMKWSLIKHDISKFIGVYGNIASLNESRSSTKYILHNAFQLYKLKHLKGLGFCFLHCWFLSKDVFKWRDLCEILQKTTPMT